MTSKTKNNLNAAFAGESMAYQKYMYFGKLAQKKGNAEVAELFFSTAQHEIGHAEGHLRFLYPEELLTVEDLLKIAMEGETHEYTEMYPGFEKEAIKENLEFEAAEFREQISESKEHAEWFQTKLDKISKVFKGLALVEKAHAKKYEDALTQVQNQARNK